MNKIGKGQLLYNRAKGLIPGGTQLLSKRPEMFLPDYWPSYYSRAQGAYIWDLDGRRYIDISINGVGAFSLGYADPDVNGAVIRAVHEGSSCTLNCPEEAELANVLCEIHPWAQMVRYARTGGEAMTIAVRIARAKTGRSKVAFCGYHGWHDWYLSANLTESDALGKKGIHLTGLDPSGVPAELAGTALPFHYHSLDELITIIESTHGQLAAIITEVQRGVRPRPGYLEEVKRIAQEIGAVLIFDEITSAFRMNLGGLHLLYCVSPDLAVFAKALGNGYPIAAVIGTQEVMQAAQTTFISSTNWTERIGPVAALAMIEKYKRIQAHEKITHAGQLLQNLWQSEAKRCGIDVAVYHPDMPATATLQFKYLNARAIKTLLCQMMLEKGFLDNASFYATCAHTDEIIEQYTLAVYEIFPRLAEAIERNRVENQLWGAIGHSGFERLT